jgi:hypothetical protein
MKKHNLFFKILAAGILTVFSFSLQGKIPLLAIMLWITAFTILMKGEKYWLLIPLSLSFNMPAIPVMDKFIETSEILIFFVFMIYLAERLRPTQALIKKTMFDSAAIFLYTGWVFMIYFLNPSGLAIFGADIFGARSYIKILLAFFSYVVISRQRIEEADARTIILFMILGALVKIPNSMISYYSGRVGIVDINEEYQFYTWHQVLGGSAIIISAWAFAKYKFKDLISFFKRPFWLYVGCFLIGLLSGKRAALASICLIPLFTAVFLKRQKIYLITVISIVGIMLLSMSFYIKEIIDYLPVRAQRALAQVLNPEDIDYRLAHVKEERFREELRTIAWDVIKENPVLGKKGYNLTEDDIAIGTSGGRSWHTTWLGIAADFGLPAAFIWLLFYIQFFGCLNRNRRLVKPDTAESTLVSMQFLLLIISVLRSWTSGHSAFLPYQMWWTYAVMVALKRSKLYDKKVSV